MCGVLFELYRKFATKRNDDTDTFVLSVFCGLKVASVYATYNLVYTALAQIISLIRGSTSFVLGQSFHKDKTFFEKVYNAYSAMQSMIGDFLLLISSTFSGMISTAVTWLCCERRVVAFVVYN